MNTPKPEQSESVLVPWDQKDSAPEVVRPEPYGATGHQGPVACTSMAELEQLFQQGAVTAGPSWVWTPEGDHWQPAAELPELAEPCLLWLRATAAQRRKKGLQNLALWSFIGLAVWSRDTSQVPIIWMLLAFGWGFVPLLMSSWNLYRLQSNPAASLLDLSRTLRWGYWSSQQARSEGTRLLAGLIGCVAVLQMYSAGTISLSLTQPVSALAKWEMATVVWGQGVQDGELWRLLTGTLLHGGLIHVGFNLFILWYLGSELEKLLGPWRVWTLCLLAGTAGAAATSFINPLTPSLGFSGAVCGLMGVQLAMAIRYKGLPPAMGRIAYVNMALLVGIGFIGQGVIDNTGHAGGFIGGLLVGLLMFRSRQALPLKKTKASMALGAMSGLVYLAGVMLIVWFALARYPM